MRLEHIRKSILTASALGLVLLFAACGTQADPIPAPDIQGTIDAAVRATATAQPTSAPTPTATPQPSGPMRDTEATPSPTATPTPVATPTPTQELVANVDNFNLESASLQIEDIPDGFILRNMRFETSEDSLQTRVWELAEQWGFVASYVESYVREEFLTGAQISDAVVLYESVGGAKDAMAGRKEILDSTWSESDDISSFSISEVTLSAELPTKAFRTDVTSAEGDELVSYYIAFRMNNVLGIVGRVTFPIAASFDETKILADKLEARIKAEFDEPTGPTLLD